MSQTEPLASEDTTPEVIFLTPRQRAIYAFLLQTIVSDQRFPTFREVGEHFGILSPNGIMCHFNALEKKGMITRGVNKACAIQLCGVRLSYSFEDNEAGQRARAILETVNEEVQDDSGNQSGQDVPRAANSPRPLAPDAHGACGL